LNINNDEGKLLVKIARDAIETYIKEGRKIAPPKDLPEKLYNKSGVFVTINICKDGNELRGCIGHPYPDVALIEAIIDSGIAAAVSDPRFDPIIVDELDEVIIEVSVLTTPKLIVVKTPREYPSKVQLGEDGLIVKWAWGSGLLLPQVPVEYNWSVEEFLSHTCMKAGATPDTWLSPDTKIYKFQAIIFGELLPRGLVVRKKA